MKRKNQGFTLLELIVTISIMAIFSGVVLTVIGTAAHSYRSTSGSAKVQMEAQNIMDQIQDMIIDVNRSVYYAYGNCIDSNTTDPISNDIDSDAGAVIQDKTFYACTGKEDKDAPADPAGKTYDYTCNLVQWDSNSQKLYYARSTWKGIETEKKNTTGASENQEESETLSENGNGDAATGKSDDDAPINLTDMDMEQANAQSDDTSDVTVVTTPVSQRTTTEKTLLAENVTDFRVDVSKAVSERIVRFRFTVRLNGKETTTVHTVNLRNQIQVSKPFEGYSSTTEKAAITILRYPETVEAGKTVKGFSSYKKGNIDPSTVCWVVASDNATFNGGNGGDDASVTLRANEGLQDGIAITVHVEANTSDGQTVQSNPVTITVKDVVPQSLECTTDKILLGVGGNSYDLKSLGWKVKYSDGSSKDLSEDELNKIQWTTSTSIEGVTVAADDANGGTITTTKGTDGPGTTADNSKFTVTASYTTESGNVAFSKTIQVILVRLDIMSSKETFTVGDNKNLTYSYKVGGVEQNSANNKISNSNNNIGNIQFAYTFNTDNNQTTNGTTGNPKTMSTGDTFVADDVGSWTVTATLDMSTVNGVNGTISGTKYFKVDKFQKGEIVKKYHLVAGQKQKLFEDFSDVPTNYDSINICEKPLSGDVQQCTNNQSSILNLSGNDCNNFSINMKSVSANIMNYEYVLILVETEKIVYRFYIYPVVYNVYNCELGETTTPFVYVPTDENSIRDSSNLIQTDEENGQGYTFLYEFKKTEDNTTYKAQIRLSIAPYTGIGIVNSDSISSSKNKWIMRMCEKGTSDWIYYRLENGNWYEFQNAQNQDKTKMVDYYWNVNHTIRINDMDIHNSTFWKNWNV